MAVFSLSFNNYISLHQIICTHYLLSASVEEVGLRGLLGVPKFSYLTKSKSLEVELGEIYTLEIINSVVVNPLSKPSSLKI
nr:MAG TPA: hypothetical protein [Caudoviricetes sp.]